MKRKKNNEIKFDPANYAYMDNPDMTLDGWLWEFERRSEAYKKAYKKLFDKSDFDCDGLLFLESCHFDPSKKWSEVDRVSSYLSKAHPVEVINLKWGHAIPSNDSDPFMFKDTRFELKNGKVTITYSSRHSHPLDTLRHEIGKESIAMALINLDANKADILRIVEDKLDEWKKALKIAPKRAAKITEGKSIWKSYLMVYDMKNENDKLLFREIGSKLYDCFHHARYENDRNVENYYKQAAALIDGGYKTLLPAVK